MSGSSLAEKVVVITGAAGGIGSALCRRLVREGARVVAVDVDGERLAQLARDLGNRAIALQCDIRDPQACCAVIAEARARFGAVDALINNAGISHHSRFADTAPAVVERVMDVNFYGSVNMTRAVLDDVRARRGVIVVVSSVAGFAPLIERAAYAASKHALHGLFETLAAELRPAGVGVVMICPSFVRTEIDARALTATGGVGVPKKRVAGRVSEPDELAEQILRALIARPRRVIPSLVGKLSLALSALAPGLYERLMVRSVARG
ncbi:MAG: SDR family oxidoreductase [Polyangiaceae bacterium]|nr:SDR family oxidoreductase [Polyangiaceae bacterium]